MGVNMVTIVMYVGELAANSLLDSATHTLETEGEQYRALDSSSQPDVFSFLRTLVERSSSRGEQIRSSLLDPMLADKMIGQLQDRTGNSTSCVQLLLCKVSPLLATAQLATKQTLASLLTSSIQQSSKLWLELVSSESPGRDLLLARSEECEDRHPDCALLHFGDSNTLS